MNPNRSRTSCLVYFPGLTKRYMPKRKTSSPLNTFRLGATIFSGNWSPTKRRLSWSLEWALKSSGIWISSHPSIVAHLPRSTLSKGKEWGSKGRQIWFNSCRCNRVCTRTIRSATRLGMLGDPATIARFNIFIYLEHSDAIFKLNPVNTMPLFLAQLRLRPERCLILGLGQSLPWKILDRFVLWSERRLSGDLLFFHKTKNGRKTGFQDGRSCKPAKVLLKDVCTTTLFLRTKLWSKWNWPHWDISKEMGGIAYGFAWRRSNIWP